MDVERCIICGEPIPEGIQVCFACETKSENVLNKESCKINKRG